MGRNIVTMTDKKYNDYLDQHIGNVKKGFEWLVSKGIVEDPDGSLAK